MDTAEAHFHRGRMLGVKGQHNEAIKEYRKALEIDPHYRPARANLELRRLLYERGAIRRR